MGHYQARQPQAVPSLPSSSQKMDNLLEVIWSINSRAGFQPRSCWLHAQSIQQYAFNRMSKRDTVPSISWELLGNPTYVASFSIFLGLDPSRECHLLAPGPGQHTATMATSISHADWGSASPDKPSECPAQSGWASFQRESKQPIPKWMMCHCPTTSSHLMVWAMVKGNQYFLPPDYCEDLGGGVCSSWQMPST